MKFAILSDLSLIFSAIPGKARIRAIALFVMLSMQSVLELGFILVLSYMAMAFTNPERINDSLLFGLIYSVFPGLRAWASEPRHLMVLAGVVVVIISLLKNLVAFVAAYATIILSEQISISIGDEIIDHYLHSPYLWHLSGDSSLTIQRMGWRRHISSMLVSLLTIYTNILTMLVLFFALLSSEPVLTMMVLGVTCISGGLLYLSIRKNIDIASQQQARSAQEETRGLLCATRGIRDVIIYRQQDVFRQQVTEAAQKGVAARTFVNIAPTLPTWVLEVIGFCVVVLALVFLVFYEQADVARISVTLSMLLLTAWRVLPYANRVVSHVVSIRGIRYMVLQVIELLHGLRSAKKHIPQAKEEVFALQKEISFANVCFRYPNASDNTLSDISFTLRAGECLGIIGPSGGGKSTLVGLLSGLLTPSAGIITIDGMELTPAKTAGLARQTGYVPQSPFLFAGTLAENVAFSQWGQKPDLNKVARACERAAIDFVDKDGEGYLRRIGENGAGLSGGQAQRVSIARALFTEPRLLIFDEATSALDQQTELSIQQTIDTIANDVTCVIVAHRLTTVEHCDSIIWLEGGKIVMHGSAGDVLAAYAHNERDRQKS